MQKLIVKSSSEMFKKNDESSQSMLTSNSSAQVRTSQIMNSKKQSVAHEL